MKKSHAAVAVLFIALSAVMTWPLVYNLDRAVAWPGDPFINVWVLDWDWYATFHQPLSLFEANAFHPGRYALAYSENLYGIALLLFPFRAAGVTPLAAHNIAILAGFAFSGFAAYLLGRHMSGSAWAGIAAGVFYAFLPFRFTHVPQVQHVWGGWLPLMVLLLLRHAEQPSWRRAAAFGAAFLMNGLTNIHALLFGAVAVGFTMLYVGPPNVGPPHVGPPPPAASRRRRPYAQLAICTLIASLLLLPFLLPYLHVAKLYGMERNWDEVRRFSAVPSDWLAANATNRVYQRFANTATDPERWLFPGALCFVIGAFAAVSRNRKSAAIGLLWIILGFVGSLGAHTFFHRLLFDYVPGFRAIRVPARWSMIAYVGIAIVVALGTAALARDRKWVAPLIAIAFVAEMWSAPFLSFMAIPDAPPVYRWIAQTKPKAILELPMEHPDEYMAMLRSTVHHRPMLNGISGFAPPDYTRLRTAASRDRIADMFLDDVRRMGADTIVVHADPMGVNIRTWLERELARGRISFVQRFDGGIGGDWVFRIGGPQKNDERVGAFLRGQHTPNELPFGFMDYPVPDRFYADRASFVGWAMSPYGVREINLLFNNGLIREKVNVFEDADLKGLFPFYDATTHPRFSRVFERRPPGVWERTDVQVEIIDGRGRRTLLPDRFFRWVRTGP